MPAKVRSSSTASALDDAVQVDKPSGVGAGDTLIAIHFNDWDISGTGAPSGWTSLASRYAHGYIAVRVWRKTATDNEPSSYQFRQPEAAVGIVHLLCVTDADTSVSPQVAVDLILDDLGGTTPTVRPAAGSHLEIRAAGVFGYPDETVSWTAPSGYALRGSAQYDEWLTSAAASRQLNSSAPSGSKSFGITPDDPRTGVGVTISLASAAASIPDPGPPPPAFTPGVGSALYRWVFTRWDGTYLDDLELSGVTFDKRIGQAGTFSATIDVTPKVRDRVARIISPDPAVLGTGPGVVTCQVIRDGVPWGEYWITAATVSQSGRAAPTISLTGSTVDAYMTQVEIQDDILFEGEDQIDIARALIASMQERDHANLRLVPQSGTSGVSRDRAYTANEGTYGQRLQELSQVENGFEWMVNIVAGSGNLERHWVWGAPTLGSSQVEHVFGNGLAGGDILQWSEEIDALRGGTYWRARGDAASDDASTTGASIMSDPVLAQAHLDAGWPRLDRTITHSSVSEMSTLDAYAAYWAANAPGSLRVDSVTVALGSTPTFTPNSLGDQARIFLHNGWHPLQSRVRRIIGIGITPPSRDGGKEIAQLIFEGIEAPTSG